MWCLKDKNINYKQDVMQKDLHMDQYLEGKSLQISSIVNSEQQEKHEVR